MPLLKGMSWDHPRGYDPMVASAKAFNEIYTILKNKYGEWITYNPEFNKKTFILWILPILLFLIGGAIILKKLIVQK